MPPEVNPVKSTGACALVAPDPEHDQFTPKYLIAAYDAHKRVMRTSLSCAAQPAIFVADQTLPWLQVKQEDAVDLSFNGGGGVQGHQRFGS